MSGMRAVAGASLLLVASLAAAHVPCQAVQIPATSRSRQMAITVDDLPAVSTQMDLPTQRAITDGLLASMARHDIRATGFVNEGKLYTSGLLDSARVRLLASWIDAGHDLGNHTYSHPSLYRTPLAEFEQDVLRGEQITRGLMSRAGRSLTYFRHPFLNTGPDLETKHAFEAFLARRGYVVAPVTIDNQEWIFARAYDRALDRGDARAAHRVETAYLSYMDSIVGYYEQQSRALLAYEVRQILLIHANRLNAAALDGLVARLQQRGYRFVTLEEALRDDAYARPDRYAGQAGITWLHRWALTEGKPGSFFRGEPDVPAFVRRIAGLDAR